MLAAKLRTRAPLGVTLVLVLCVVLARDLWAATTLIQDDDAEALFYQLLDEGNADYARAGVAQQYGDAVAAELATYWCSPEPGDGCEDTAIMAAWQRFADALGQGADVNAVGQHIADSDPSLAIALAVYWCSPEPGDGCDETVFMEAWDLFDESVGDAYDVTSAVAAVQAAFGEPVAAAVGAYVCGHPTCYAGVEEHPDVTRPPASDGGHAGPKFKNAPKQKTTRRE